MNAPHDAQWRQARGCCYLIYEHAHCAHCRNVYLPYRKYGLAIKVCPRCWEREIARALPYESHEG